MEKYCNSCGRVFKDSDFKFCPYCSNLLKIRLGRQPIPRKLRHQVFQRDGYRCRECGATNKQTRLHVDHIKPVAKGGTNDLDNLQTLCEECNLAKYTDEWVGGKFTPNVSKKTQQDTQKNQKPKRIKRKKLSLDEIIPKLNEFSDYESVRVLSKAFNVPINDIYEWYSKGKESIGGYVEFYEKINECTPKIAYEIEKYYRKTEEYEQLRLEYAKEMKDKGYW